MDDIMSVDELLGEMRSCVKRMHMESLIGGPALLQKCAILCTRYPQPIERFLSKLEAFLLNVNEPSLNLEQVGPFEQTLMKEHITTNNYGGILKEENTPKPHSRFESLCDDTTPSPGSSLGKRPAPTYKTPNQNNADKVSTQDSNSGSSVSPGSHMKNLDASLAQQLNAKGAVYSTRTNQGQSVVQLNESLAPRGAFESSANADALGARCKLRCEEEDHDNVPQRYRFMFTTLDERARALDRHLIKLQTQMCKLANIPDGGLQPVGVPSQETVWVCGRICCDASEGRINKSSVVLEGSRRDSGGRRVILDLQEVKAYALFPGQIVLVEGVNSSGRKMTAKRIIEGVCHPQQCTPASKLLEYHHNEYYQNGAPLNVITAAGPFTTSDSLDYQPLQDLLVEALKTKPDVVILLGPFVDIAQPLLATGDVVLPDDVDAEDNTEGASSMDESGSAAKIPKFHQASYEMVFAEKVARDCFGQMFNSEEDFGTLPTKFILVPSLQDAHHEFVFPQPPFGDRDRVDTAYFEEPLGVLQIPHSKPTERGHRVHLMPNPCMFRVNEVLFGVCSNDSLFSLSSDEVSQNIGTNRLTRLAGHMLMQQSFCPQFPAPQNVLAQYDMRHARHWEFKKQPDVLITASKLAAMAKDVCGTLVVNPGHLTRGAGGGTYANMHIHPLKESELRNVAIAAAESKTSESDAAVDASVPHKVSSRTFVNIVRI